MTVGITELPPEGMQLGGVALAGDAERGTKTTDGLSLLFTTAGITVQGPQPQIERLLVWSGLDSASCREKIVLPDGRNAAVMELTSGGQSIRFLLPLDTVTPGQAAYLDQALPAWLSRYKGAGASTSAPPPAAPASSTSGTPAMSTAATGAGVAMASGGPAAGPAAANGSSREASEPGLAVASGVTTVPPPPAPSTPPAAAPPPPPVAPTPTPPPVAAPARPTPPVTSAPPAPTPPPPVWAPNGASGATGPTAPPSGGSNGWVVASDPLPAGAAWDAPPTDAAPPAGVGAPPAKKGRVSRKERKAAESAAAAAAAGAAVAGMASTGAASTGAASTTAPPPGTVSPLLPPSQPPTDPVPLAGDPLPPPPPESTSATAPGPVVWKPPIDPATGAALWDQTAPPEAAPAPAPAKGWRKKSKAGATAAVATEAAATVVATATGGEPGRPVDLMSPVGADKPARKSSRATLAVLLVVLVVVVGGVAFFAVKRTNNSTPTTVAVPAPSPALVDSALAASVNLRLTDLPAGWVRAATDQAPRPPLAPVAAQARAGQALAACLGQPLALVAGLFGSAGLPGQTAAVRSPAFADGADPGIQMVSQSTVMQTTADAQSLAAPFGNPNFATCFGQYQSSLVSAAVPGATAAVQTVQLPAPAGVRSFGYLTTFTIPNQGTEVVGQAFMLGGRVETLLEPSTNGPSVPSAPFAAAYDSVVGRLARSADK